MVGEGVYAELSRVRPPQQDRSRRAQQAALDAFEALLVDRPLAKVTVQEVADRAGLSITSVYARFDGKQALVLALHERVVAEGIEWMDLVLASDAPPDGPLEDIVSMIVGQALGFAVAHQHVFRVVLAASDDETNERASAFIRAGSERIAAVLVPRLATRPRQAARDVDFAWRSVVAVLQQMWALGGADPSRFPLSQSQLATRLSQQFLAAVGHETGA